ncbi:hypothetical protein J1605_014109 [Eschrichtius robustus]|uniref:Uncharacterized protein n=1 Tax=Eschrichtius robustus TaxID=9764 RepID=A0AB34GEV5_ESCRO|nr:hypothetical protein J1605_014109 [Eschrichtius robustus]
MRHLSHCPSSDSQQKPNGEPELPPYLAVMRGHGFKSWSGKIPHATEQLSLCATTTEARVPQLLKLTRLEPVLHNKRIHRNEKPTHRNEE